MKEAFLQQSAFSDVDSYCPVEKQLGMMDIILTFHERALAASKTGQPVHQIVSLPVVEEIHRMKETIPADDLGRLEALKKQVEKAFEG